MTYRIIGDDRKRGLEWAIPRLDAGPGDWDRASCLILEKDGSITAVVVYNHWYPKNSVEISVAAIGGKWLTRPFLSAVFRNPFVEWEMRRIGASIAAHNAKSIRFCEHLGFVREGVIRDGVSEGIDLLKYGMLRRECRYLGNFSEQTVRASRPEPGSHRTGAAAIQHGNGATAIRT